MTNINELRVLHAELVKKMIHWEAEVVALPAGPDRDYAGRQHAETINRAAVIKAKIEAAR